MTDSTTTTARKAHLADERVQVKTLRGARSYYSKCLAEFDLILHRHYEGVILPHDLDTFVLYVTFARRYHYVKCRIAGTEPDAVTVEEIADNWRRQLAPWMGANTFTEAIRRVHDNLRTRRRYSGDEMFHILFTPGEHVEGLRYVQSQHQKRAKASERSRRYRLNHPAKVRAGNRTEGGIHRSTRWRQAKFPPKRPKKPA